MGIQGEVRWDEPLSRHTSLKVGGPADVLVIPVSLSALKMLIQRTGPAKVGVFVMGGTNLLVRDGGIRGIVIKLSHLQGIQRIGQAVIRAEGGAVMPLVSRAAASYGLSGLEFALGIPGTVGGAVVMNAGIRQGAVSDVLAGIQILTPKGELLTLSRTQLDFGYRWSKLPQGIIVSADFRLKKGQKEKIRQRMKQFIKYRKDTQPLQWSNAGSVFKNPNGEYAAELIESLGLKGLQIGGAQVSLQHSNFIVNHGRATARDVLALIRVIGRKAEDEAGITLELELKIVGAHPTPVKRRSRS